MKTFVKFFLSIILLGIMSFATAQNVVTMKYVATYPNPVGTSTITATRTITFDTLYGDQSTITGTRIVLRDIDGSLLTGIDAYNKLNQPIWGADNNKKFNDIIPHLTPEVPALLYISNWHSFDVTNPPTEDVMYVTRRWEASLGLFGNWIVFKDMPLAAVPYWDLFGVEEYKIAGEPDSYSIPNPEYPANVAQRNAEKAQYKQILFDNFVILCDAVFPILYDHVYPVTVNSVAWYIKIDGRFVTTEVIDGKYNAKRKFVPMLSAQSITSPKWDYYVDRTIGMSNVAAYLSGVAR